MAGHHQVEWEWMSLSLDCKWWEPESEWQWGCFEWVWEKKTRCLNTRWQCLNPTWLEFKMAAIIKLSQNEWVKFLSQRLQNSRWLPSSSWVRVNEWELFNQTLQNSRWLPSSSWVRMNEWSFWIQYGRIQDDCHHQVESEWMSEGFFCAMVGTNPGKWEWVWEEKLRWLNPRWLPSSSWDENK